MTACQTCFLLFLVFFLPVTPALSQASYSENCLTRHEGNDRYASYSPDGDQIIFESDRNGNWDIFLMNLSSRITTPLLNTGKDERRPDWHPEGQKILFESIEGGTSTLIEYNLADQSQEIVLDQDQLAGEFLFARYAPDGKRIAFTLKRSDDTFDIYLYALESKKLTRLNQNELRNVYPYWSPNGKELLVFSRKDTDNKIDEIYRIKLKNNKWTRLTNWPRHNFCPSWSNDGKKIALVISMEDLRAEIYTMNRRGKKLQRITFNDSGDTLPVWSPQDDKLLITAFRNGNYEICEIQLR